MDDDALDELDARLAALREQALEQIALSQKIRVALERAAGGVATGDGARPVSVRRTRHRASAPRAPAPASVSAAPGEASWRTLGARLRHRMRLA